jgi:hypothetical protein
MILAQMPSCGMALFIHTGTQGSRDAAGPGCLEGAISTASDLGIRISGNPLSVSGNADKAPLGKRRMPLAVHCL